MIGVRLDGEFQIGIIVQAGEREGPQFILPAWFINGNVGSLPRDEFEIFGLFKSYAVDVVGYRGNR
jgi:hypothetical protein